MINLYEALQAVLLTESKESDIIDAVNNGYRLQITYDDNLDKNLANKIRYPKGVNPTGERTILPYCYGEDSRSHALTLRAFQIDNTATRRGAPKWKYFKLNNITSLHVDKTKPFKFTPQVMGYSNAPEFNSQGDRLMSRVIAIKPITFSSDVEKEKAKTEYIRNAPKMVSKDGPIPYASQQRRKSVYTSQPRSKKYQQWAKNVDMSKRDDIDKLSDDFWKQYEEEEQLQQSVPKPNNTSTKPIDAQTEQDYEDEWLKTHHGNEF